MYDLELREKEIFETIKKIKNIDFVIIGGYAVNVYTPPRFSVDADIVVLDSAAAKKAAMILEMAQYTKAAESNAQTPYHGEFVRYEKKIEKGFTVSVDILIGKVLDRQTGAFVSAEWVFKNSSVKTLQGKTMTEHIKVRVQSPEALIVMKLLSCRTTDMRDIFMMIVHVGDFSFIKKEVSERADFKQHYTKLKE